MCSGRPIYEFDVTNKRLETAQQVLRTAKDKISVDTCVDIFFELGFGDALKYDADDPHSEKLTILAISPLQMVALAAAIAAVAESGGTRRLALGAQQ